jgi:hypothetical protein
MEEHYVIIHEPGSEYIGHISPSNGTSSNIFSTMLSFFDQNNINLDQLSAVGCDGTNVNTGIHKGVIRLLEVHLGRPLQWFICLLHANELPLRHLFSFLDGNTKGPSTYSGIIGKSLEKCENLNIVNFKSIPMSDIPVDMVQDLSTDQDILLKLCKGISKGQIHPDLAARKPGPLSHSRWLTAAIRILRLYVSTINPTTQLVTLSTFIMTVYAPMWFHIKCKPSCKYGAIHLWRMIHLSRYMSKEEKDVIDPVIQRNVFFGHPENVLLTMLCDDRNYVCELAIRRIIEARKKRTALRQFQVPLLNFNATEYIDLIDWISLPRFEPPIMRHMDSDSLNDILTEKTIPTLYNVKFPCHTQAVERSIRLVSEASSSVCGEESRDGLIRAKIKSRSVMPTFNTKREYNLE